MYFSHVLFLSSSDHLSSQKSSSLPSFRTSLTYCNGLLLPFNSTDFLSHINETDKRPSRKKYFNPNGKDSDDLSCLESMWRLMYQYPPLSRPSFHLYFSSPFYVLSSFFIFYSPHLSSYTYRSDTHEYSGQRTQQKALLAFVRVDVMKGFEWFLTR